ncbi:Leucine-rich repeat serine/threonine-protein kinase 2 [Phytophthora pseudosyringae]|uniref:Leucine-rich repeat serine/threonine-protein kinase 2 n=1 Tax=Phytophthora pseudosyringae TaxID=221518 RepID=A0A8T1VLI9_9STRA|nr:Leucine-rich repeat serine/threonine-protein kinase 2 [Phytophthora pseudosyringae]
MEQIEFFVSGVSDTYLLLKDLKSVEERSAFLGLLKTELEKPQGKYESDQLEVMKKAYEDIASKLETEGNFHPHVVRLFGACHVGRPFFVCEYATNGTLVSYLNKYPDQLWVKLHEAALGVQYLHTRSVVHGDLKGNNIVVGSDKKAKVTDFGLSSVTSSDVGLTKPTVSAAWNWVAPECLFDAKVRPTFASDVYSLGMRIAEALRVVEAVKSGKDPHHSCRGALLPDSQWNTT